jgi:hypothetical protein
MGITAPGAIVAPAPHHRRVSAWPFMVQAGAGAAGVPRRQEVEFADGSRVWLLRVERAGLDDLDALFLRELGEPAAGTLVDLRALVPNVAPALLRADVLEMAGRVHMALRARFGSRDELLQAAVACGRAA